MPSRERLTIDRCNSTTRAAPSAALIGLVPNTRVSCPSPYRVACSNGSWWDAAKTSSIAEFTRSEIIVDARTPSRRTFLGLAAGLPVGAALAACGTAGPQRADPNSATYWYLTGQPGEGIRKQSVDRFNKANSSNQIVATAFQNDAYKTKIKTAIGAGKAPSMIWG